MRKVMLWGYSGDGTFDSVCREMSRRNKPHVLLDQRDYSAVQFELDTAGGVNGYFQLAAQRVEVDEIGAIFVRPLDGREIARNTSTGPGDVDAFESKIVAMERRLFVWTDIADILVANRPTAMATNLSKPFQSELIRTQGFAIPDTLVTTTPDAVHEFIATHGDVIVKSISGQVSIASRVLSADTDRIGDVGHCVTQFQKYIAGTDWRVHVIGDEVFACEVQCEADDYRVLDDSSGALRIAASQLPESISERCHALARFLNIPIAGIDLRRTTDDVWYCFEVNAAPGFAYFERVAGQPLAAAVADLLIGGSRGFSA